MKTAIIGLGNIGSRLASNLTAGGEDVIISERNLAKVEQLAKKLGARAVPIEDALRAADVVILAIWLDAIKDLVAAHRGALAGNIVVDPSNPIAPDGKGSFKKIIPTDQSSGKTIASLLPQDTELVKAFGTLKPNR
jgi:8-hydroxy-5-deazaflavin:NADPH oxidoreductase